MITKTILIEEAVNKQVKAALQDERILNALQITAAKRRKNTGEGELIRRALKTGLAIELRKLVRLQSQE